MIIMKKRKLVYYAIKNNSNERSVAIAINFLFLNVTISACQRDFFLFLFLYEIIFGILCYCLGTKLGGKNQRNKFDDFRLKNIIQLAIHI